MKDLRIEEATFFSKPNAIFKERKEWEKETQGISRAWEFNGLLVMASVGIMQDGREWLHVSFSRRSKLPTYADLQLVKREFIGKDKKALIMNSKRSLILSYIILLKRWAYELF